MENTATDVQPIAFDSATQVNEILDRIRVSLYTHVEGQSRGKNGVREDMFRREVEELLEKEFLANLPTMIHQNITVKGLSWDEHEARSSQATQPLDTALLRETIAAQDTAFQLSSIGCSKRATKPTLLASQVDSRIQKVIKSGEDKSALLEEQRKRREARRRLVKEDIPGKAEAAADLQKVEALLQQISSELPKQVLKAQRAASVASEVDRLSKAP